MADKPRKSILPFSVLGDNISQFIREMEPEISIYDSEDFGSETINETLSSLISELRGNLFRRANTADQCIAYNKLGIAYYRLHKFDKAELCHQQHLVLSQPAPPGPLTEKRVLDKNEMKIALLNLGCVFHMKMDRDLALEAFVESLRLAEEIEDKASQARILGNMSNIYENIFDFDTAIECELKRFELLSDLCDVNGQIKCACALGSLHQLIGELRDSIMYYEKAVINLRMKIVSIQIDEIEKAQEEAAQKNSGEAAPDVTEKPPEEVVD